MKQWRDKDGTVWNGRPIVVAGRLVVNPTESELTEAGYTEFEPAGPTEEELLDMVKRSKLSEVDAWDRSAAVNEFALGGQAMWLSVEERQQLASQISAHQAAGRAAMTRWFCGRAYTFSLTAWQQMLVDLETYAGDALNVTEAHRAAIRALESREEVETYDYTRGYPEKLQF